MAEEFSPWNDAVAKPIVEFYNVTKNFGDFVAIDNVSLKIYEREFFALLGPSGCGKTTLMRMLAGFADPTSGEVMLDGENLAGRPPNDRPVNMMFQSYALFPHLNVEDNIAFGLRRSNIAKPEINRRTEEMLQLVQLEDFARRKPHQLSGGQKQRVALARSLAKRPKILLLDEPLGALDKKLRQQTQFELVNIQETLGTTFIIVTHDQEEAMTVASRIAVMREGKFQQIAPPMELYEQPNSRYVADFIGDVNFIEGQAKKLANGNLLLEWTEGEVAIKIQSRGEPFTAGQATFAIRPEKILTSTQPLTPGKFSIEGIVDDIAYVGNITTYHVRLKNGAIIKAQESNQHHSAKRRFNWEDPIWLSWADDAGILLGE